VPPESDRKVTVAALAACDPVTPALPVLVTDENDDREDTESLNPRHCQSIPVVKKDQLTLAADADGDFSSDHTIKPIRTN